MRKGQEEWEGYKRCRMRMLTYNLKIAGVRGSFNHSDGLIFYLKISKLILKKGECLRNVEKYGRHICTFSKRFGTNGIVKGMGKSRDLWDDHEKCERVTCGTHLHHAPRLQSVITLWIQFTYHF